MSGEKNEQGHWEIDESELDHVFRKPAREPRQKIVSQPLEKTSETGTLGDEVRMLRDQIDAMTAERNRERGHGVDQIEDLRTRLDGAEAERVRLKALLTDQRAKVEVPLRRSFWSRLVG